jgi:ribosome production factor 2
MKGAKTSQVGVDALKSFQKLRSARYNVSLSHKKNQVYPFEDAGKIESVCSKYDAGFFLFTSTQKKRPHNLVIGRIYSDKILDMVEFGVSDIKAATSLKFEDG